MSTKIIYDIATGDVLHVQGWCKPWPKEVFIDSYVTAYGVLHEDIDCIILEEDYSSEQWKNIFYLVAGVNTPRPPFGLVVSATDILIGETATISNLPEGTEVYLDDVLAGTIDATGEMSISSNVLRHFHLKFVKHPYLDEEVSIHVT